MVQMKTWTIWKIKQLDLRLWKAMNGKNYLIPDKILYSLAESFKQENTLGFWLTFLRLVPLLKKQNINRTFSVQK